MAAIPIQCYQANFTQNSDTEVLLGGVQRITIRTSADCYVDFDQPSAPTTSFKLLAASTADTTIEISGASVQKLHTRGVSGSGTLYIIACVN